MRCNDHPGLAVFGCAEEKGINLVELAILLGYNVDDMGALLDGKTVIDEAFAERLECIFDIPSDEWLKVQKRYEKRLIHVRNFKRLDMIAFGFSCAWVAWLISEIIASGMGIFTWNILYCMYFAASGLLFSIISNWKSREFFEWSIELYFKHWSAYFIPVYAIHIFHC